MDIPALIFNALAVFTAFAALAVSLIMSSRQNDLGHNANQLPVVVELFSEIRSYEFLRKEEELWRDLPKISAPVPLSELPAPLKEYAFNVTNFYSMIAYLWMLQAVDERLAIWPVHFRAVKTWETIRPFVQAERAARGAEHSFLNVLETFVAKIEETDIRHYLGSLQGRVHE
ncbi:hypothetical protein AB0I92_10685 [Micromonospora chalcea]|uniref:hypothetical protein n=1 Tax=Micromonospora chalcea TaxID=1874 RepID=UPI0033D69D43